MAKRLSNYQIEEIVRSFIAGESIDILSEEYNCNKLTISRNLKKKIGEKKYKDLINKKKHKKNKNFNSQKVVEDASNDNLPSDSKDKLIKNKDIDNFEINLFTEIIPLHQEIENIPRKELSSIPISDIDFPKIVYMIVDKKIELTTKLLKDYPAWQFLSEKELNRKTIEIYYDLKIAKRFCNSNQKVIKIPNTKVFKIVAPILVSRGISRIVSEENLIAL